MNLKNTFDFILDLQFNNNRNWFQQNEARYKKAKTEFEIFASALIAGLQDIDPEIGMLSAKDCTFRIYRDIRFSPNKEPYKNNMGAYIVKGGKKSPFAGYYIHLEPGASFIGGGVYMPEPAVLNAIRQEIFENNAEFRKIIDNPVFKNIFTGLYGEKLKTAPKGFPKDFHDVEILKHKHYSPFASLDDNFWESENPEAKVLEGFAALKDFNHFMNRVIEGVVGK